MTLVCGRHINCSREWSRRQRSVEERRIGAHDGSREGPCQHRPVATRCAPPRSRESNSDRSSSRPMSSTSQREAPTRPWPRIRASARPYGSPRRTSRKKWWPSLTNLPPRASLTKTQTATEGTCRLYRAPNPHSPFFKNKTTFAKFS